MGVNKKSLALAIASVMAAGSASAVDLTAATPTASAFASQIAVATTGTALGVTATELDIKTKFGFSIGQGTSKYVRIELVGDATWTTALTGADFVYAGAAAAAPAFTVAQGGGAGQKFVILEVAAPTGAGNDVAPADTVTFTALTNVKKVTVTTKGDVGVTTATYATAVDAVNKTNALFTATGPYITFKNAVNIACTAGTPKKIDPNAPKGWSTLPVNSAENLFALTANAAAGVLTQAGAPLVVGDLWTTVTVDTTGDFKPFTGGVTLNAVAQTLNTAESVATSPATASFSNAQFTVTPDGTDAMAAGSYTVKVTPTGGLNLAAVDLGTCGSLAYDGSTDRADFALTPGGFYKQYLRVTNPTTTAGDVTVQVWNDSGATATFPLKNVTGAATSALASQSSTALLTIDQVYAAATAANPAFTVNGGKLRVEVRGNFGRNALDNANNTLSGRLQNGIVLQTFTTATDNTSFIMLKQ